MAVQDGARPQQVTNFDHPPQYQFAQTRKLYLCHRPFPEALHAISTDILERLRSGDEAAFEGVFRELFQPLVHYAMRFLEESEASEEVVQDAFFAVWEKRETLDIHTSLKSYLYRSVHNKCLNLIKHISIREDYKAWNEVEREEQEAHFEGEMGKSELEQRIQTAIEALPPERQKVFRMSRFEGLKYQEIADQLNISVKTVENQMGKALKALRGSLADYLPALLAVVYTLMEFFLNQE